LDYIEKPTNFYLYLIGKTLINSEPVEKEDRLPHINNETYGSLEEKGIIYLNSIKDNNNTKFKVKITLPILYHISNKLNNFEFPIFNLKYNFTWEENEISDISLILLKIW
jgi:hypothetical protein